jgi:hypothetical protein
MLGLLAAAAGLERCPQVVGFAPSADGTAVANEPVRLNYGTREAYGYQAVVYHPAIVPSSAASMSRMPANAGREMKFARRSAQSTAVSTAAGKYLLQASVAEPSGVDDRGVASDTAAVRGQQVSASDASFEEVKFQNVEARAQARSVVQWVVVTSWRGDDGSRMVLTTVRTASPASVAADGSDAADAIAPQDQVHPYAAVPVQDGWLVIQL